MNPPPYNVCIDTQKTLNYSERRKRNQQLKLELENIENKLEKIKSNDPKKPVLRRKAADLEEEIINIENSKSKDQIIDLLINKIDLMCEHRELERKMINGPYGISRESLDTILSIPVCFNPTDRPLTLSMKEELIKKYVTTNCDYSDIIQEASQKVSIELSKTPNEFTARNFKSRLNQELNNNSQKAREDGRKIEIELRNSELDFDKGLLCFLENIIDEKKNLEKRIEILENKISPKVDINNSGGNISMF